MRPCSCAITYSCTHTPPKVQARYFGAQKIKQVPLNAKPDPSQHAHPNANLDPSQHAHPTPTLTLASTP